MARVSQLSRMMQMATPHQETVTGDVASFVTDFPAPARVTAEFSPVQDLHGYANPWPAGGGVNKWDGEYLRGAYSATGSFVASNDYVSSKNMIPVTPSTGYYLVLAKATAVYICEYDSNQSFLRRNSTLAPVGGEAITISADAYYIHFSIGGAGAQAVTSPDGVGFNYPSTATTYAPYENNCPITGWTDAEVTRTGSNLLNLNDYVKRSGYAAPTVTISGDTFSTSGSTTGGRFVNFIVPVVVGQTYTVKADSLSIASVAGKIDFSDEKPTHYGTGSSSTLTIVAGITVTATKPWMIVSIQSTADYTLTGLRCNLGSTASAYEAYHGQTIAINWESSAGTVYGGYFKLNEDGSGVLVGEYAGVRITSTLPSGWVLNINASRARYTVPDMAVRTVQETGADPMVICNRYEKYASSTTPTDLCFTETRSGSIDDAWIAFWHTGYETATAWNNYIDNNEVFVTYKLATPLTYPLSASQLRTLLGTNNVWTSLNGDVTVRFFKHG